MELSPTTLRTLAAEHGTPLFIYNQDYLARRAEQLLDLHLPYGLTPRYAVKANNYPAITTLFTTMGLSFDASSSYEVDELVAQGIDPAKISLSSQQPAHNVKELIASGVKYV